MTFGEGVLAVLLLVNVVAVWASSRKMSRMSAEVHKIEVATNSMKDALVSASEDKGFRAGEKSARRREL